MISTNEELIGSLISGGYLRTPEIIEAFRAFDRADFTPEEYKNDAYINEPLPIGFGQTMSQPLTIAFMLELLEPKKGEKILEIGSGSGWQTAILAYIVSQNSNKPGRVVGIERVPELQMMAEKNISKFGFIENGIAQIFNGDGSKGWAKEGPYDKIVAGAAAEGDVPAAWRRQLKIGGRIVAPVGHNLVVIDKIAPNRYSQKEHFGFSFVPLIKG